MQVTGMSNQIIVQVYPSMVEKKKKLQPSVIQSAAC